MRKNFLSDFDPEDIYNADANRTGDVGESANDDAEMRDPNAARQHYVEVGWVCCSSL